ncbi:MAG: DUF3796 domain-containing protein [Methanocalculus sp. MSAO_Arc2]|nr:MAG: DUF3796 domain-containing protein [Methanocalculus sp. MSAO_Arc2]
MRGIDTMNQNTLKKNPIRLLGLLGFLGLLGLVTGNAGFYGYFGFFAFFAAIGKSDEMLHINLARAGYNAFIVSILGVSAAMAILAITRSLEIAALFFAGIFIAQIGTFLISFYSYEWKGDPA